jgi:hypothetical protein
MTDQVMPWLVRLKSGKAGTPSISPSPAE